MFPFINHYKLLTYHTSVLSYYRNFQTAWSFKVWTDLKSEDKKSCSEFIVWHSATYVTVEKYQVHFVGEFICFSLKKVDKAETCYRERKTIESLAIILACWN